LRRSAICVSDVRSNALRPAQGGANEITILNPAIRRSANPVPRSRRVPDPRHGFTAWTADDEGFGSLTHRHVLSPPRLASTSSLVIQQQYLDWRAMVAQIGPDEGYETEFALAMVA
jgi:hypothetical protein